MRDATFSPGGPLGGYPGVLRHLAVPAPAAGAEWTFTLPSDGSWRLRCIRALLTTSAAVANRQTGIRITDGSLIWFQSRTAAALAASGTADVTAITGSGLSNVGGTTTSWMLPLPDVIMPPGYVISSISTALDVGDQYSGIVITAEEIDAYVGQVHPDQLALHGGPHHHR